LSPKESQLDRIVFDAIIHILTLLTNVVEVFAGQIAHEGCLSIFLALQFQHSEWGSIYPEFLPECKETLEGNQKDKSSLKLFALILLRESSVFLSTLEETERFDGRSDCSPNVDGSKSPIGEAIPVSEIIISAHVCLFIHALFYRNKSKDEEGYSVDKFRFLSYLPRKSFWLLIRTLKAFFTLQEKTDVMVIENISPVINVIGLMSKDSI
jgi:hypothetical protein